MKYNSIIYNDTVNGQGMRISIFVQGCKHHCRECFNPETWNFDGGKQFTKETMDNIIFVFKKYYKYYDGISLLGGDPLCNLEITNYIIDRFRKEFGDNKTIWIWTGYTINEIFKSKQLLDTIKKCDILIDGKFEINKKDTDLLYRGSSNQKIYDLKKSFKKNKIIEWGDY